MKEESLVKYKAVDDDNYVGRPIIRAWTAPTGSRSVGNANLSHQVLFFITAVINTESDS